jgi:hypothetical protein
LGHTNKDDGIALAKTIHTGIQKNLRQTIVMNQEIIAGLFDEKYAQRSFHYLHHELCHVHDEYYQHGMFSVEGRCGQNMNKLEHMLVYGACPVWCEYIAVRLSSSSTPIDVSIDSPTNDLYLSYVLHLIESCKKNVGQEIARYRFHADVDKLLAPCQEGIILLCKIAATTQGYIDGLNIDQNIVDQVNKAIEQTYFYNTWLEQWKALKDLYAIYPKWNDTYQLLDLGKAILPCWNALGIFPKYLPDTDVLYIDVPFN